MNKFYQGIVVRLKLYWLKNQYQDQNENENQDRNQNQN